MRGTILSTSSSSVVRWTVFLVATLTAPALVMGVHAVGLVGDISCLDRTIRDVAVLEGRSSSDVHLDGVKTIRGEFGSYLQLVVVERLRGQGGRGALALAFASLAQARRTDFDTAWRLSDEATPFTEASACALTLASLPSMRRLRVSHSIKPMVPSSPPF